MGSVSGVVVDAPVTSLWRLVSTERSATNPLDWTQFSTSPPARRRRNDSSAQANGLGTPFPE